MLAIVFLAAMFISPASALGLSIDFPHRAAISPSAKLWRRAAMLFAILVGGACAASLALAIADYPAGGDRGLNGMVACVAVQCASIPVLATIGVVTQFRAHRVAHGALRAQLRWVIFGHLLALIPVAIAIPIAFSDLDRFLITGYQPIVVAIAVLWSVGYGLAVLRIRLADVDALIRSGLGYAATTTAAVAV